MMASSIKSVFEFKIEDGKLILDGILSEIITFN